MSIIPIVKSAFLIEGQTYEVASLQRPNARSLVLTAYCQLMSMICQRLIERATKQVSLRSTCKTFRFTQKDNIQFIESTTEQILSKVIDDSGFVAVTLKVREFALSYFQSHENPIISYEARPAEIKDFIEESMMTDVLSHGYISADFQHMEKCCYTKEEEAFFTMETGFTIVKPEFLSCVQFALIKARVLECRHFLFECSDTLITSIVTLLQKWHFKTTSSPIKGDIIVYFNDEQKPMHVGIVVADGEVLSKPGIKHPYSYIHGTFDLMQECFGKYVLYFTRR